MHSKQLMLRIFLPIIVLIVIYGISVIGLTLVPGVDGALTQNGPQLPPDRDARPDPDGRAVLVLTPLELLQRLAHLVPPPRRHLLRCWGVLAPNAPNGLLRGELVVELNYPASPSHRVLFNGYVR